MYAEKINVVNLLGASDAQWENFGNTVRSSHGKIQYFTHPYYYDLRDANEDYEPYKLRRDQYFKACLGKVPIIIAEQNKEYDLLEERLDGERSCPIYTIRTQNDDNLPLAYDGREAWLNFTGKLRGIGVTHATVGGVAMVMRKFTETHDYGVPKLKPEFLQVLKEFLGKEKLSAERWVEYTVQGCAGSTALYLALSGIDVALSSICYPHNPWVIFKQDSLLS